MKHAKKLVTGGELSLEPVAPLVLRQAEAFCIESGRRGLWNVLLDGGRWIFARFTRGPTLKTRKTKHTVSVSVVSTSVVLTPTNQPVLTSNLKYMHTHRQ